MVCAGPGLAGTNPRPAPLAVHPAKRVWISTRCFIGGATVHRGLMSVCSIAALAVGLFWLVTSWD
jgi:hypothetical protein